MEDGLPKSGVDITCLLGVGDRVLLNCLFPLLLELLEIELGNGAEAIEPLMLEVEALTLE